jgi:hypothetical protein
VNATLCFTDGAQPLPALHILTVALRRPIRRSASQAYIRPALGFTYMAWPCRWRSGKCLLDGNSAAACLILNETPVLVHQSPDEVH